MKNKSLPNIILFLVIVVLIILGIYLGFRTREKIQQTKSAESGNFLTRIFS